MSRSDVVMNPFIFLLICYKSQQSFLYQFGKVITVINNDSIDQKAKCDRKRDSAQKQRVLIKHLYQLAWKADLITENSLIAGPD